MVNTNKFILDACCGPKFMWYNKNHPNVIYMDIRKEPKGFIPSIPNLEINPNIVGDFTNLPNEIKNIKFKLIVWDIPHIKARNITKGALKKKFGVLNPETWPYDINKGFKELWEVLDDYGILILKFNDYHIKFKSLLKVIPKEPLFYNSMSKDNDTKNTSTRWFCFMKIPEGVK